MSARSYQTFVGKNQIVSTRPDNTESENLVTTFHRMLLSEVDLRELSKLEVNQRRARLERVLAHLVSREGVILSTSERTRLIRRVVDDTVGLGALEPILNDSTDSEIMVNGPDTIYVERAGVLQRWEGSFANDEQLRLTIDRIVSAVNRRVDESNPMVDARLPADARLPRGARVNVILPPLSLNGPIIAIRLFPEAISLAKLIEWGSLNRMTAHFLEICVKARLNIVVSGGTGSGKTTMLNALSSFIGHGERIITVEDAAELSLDQPHTIRLETRPANVEGKGAVTIRDLVRNALRMRPDRIVVRECRGGEALDMLQAMNTGHEGSLTTVHANSVTDALGRLETLASMSDVDIPFETVHSQVNSAIDVIVQLERASDGRRRVTNVSYIDSDGSAEFHAVPIGTWERTPLCEGFITQPIPEQLRERLLLVEPELDSWWK
ncbi:pilus assembly protein CpaF [Arcanobacterium wilhelmae]|uniref:Pilus assembly protein CpaF n=1 Tax=Arcanobacterium wilhelmae TaxID=1803177 RepID=A0ABT9NAY9_9ACTO|nr:CpaF family protein [Arcanobacterium wilhelmae]MDP9800885.1 pilus assembly protein CpaF [Arcanobacterium wilhelmae]WFN90252.1 CpaF family protein [Arcanobacterium wilhelmae]